MQNKHSKNDVIVKKYMDDNYKNLLNNCDNASAYVYQRNIIINILFTYLFNHGLSGYFFIQHLLHSQSTLHSSISID